VQREAERSAIGANACGAAAEHAQEDAAAAVAITTPQRGADRGGKAS
jgi:hypothetical protein